MRTKVVQIEMHFHIVDRSRRHRRTCVETTWKLKRLCKLQIANILTLVMERVVVEGHTDEYAVGCRVSGIWKAKCK